MNPNQVRLVVATANASCGIPASGQFSKWADCVDLVRDHEHSGQVRYDVLLKTRPDVLWRGRRSRVLLWLELQLAHQLGSLAAARVASLFISTAGPGPLRHEWAIVVPSSA